MEIVEKSTITFNMLIIKMDRQILRFKQIIIVGLMTLAI